MGLPIVENGIRVQALFAGNTQTRPWSTKFDYKASAPFDLSAFADAFVAQWETARVAGGTGLSGGFYTETDLLGFRIYELGDPLSGIEAIPTSPTFGTGTNATVGEAACVVSLRTANLGRAYRGRQYWGGLSVTAVVGNGLFLSTFTSALRTFVVAHQTITDAAAVNYNLSVMRRTGPDVGTRYPAQAEPVTQLITNAQPDTQRRRGVR